MSDRTACLLLVDDEPKNLIALEAILEPLGHRLARATSGQQALEQAEEHAPDLILLDVRMPDLDGISVLGKLRARGVTAPVILVTADGDREQRVKGLVAGADEFLEKPIDPAILLARVRTLLRLKWSTDDLAARNAELERMQREQRELTECLVHDLKNPISVVDMNLGFTLRQPLGADVREGLEDAQDATLRLRAMVADLLAIARLDQGTMPLHREQIAVRPLLELVARAHARTAEEKRIALTVDVPSEVSVSADPSLLRRMFDNVVENAIRHTPAEGRIALTAARGAIDRVRAERERIEVAIANTGTPIPDDERERIFGRLARARGNASSALNVGLGLYFCRRAAEVQGGAIEVRQTAEWPTAFVISLPCAA